MAAPSDMLILQFMEQNYPRWRTTQWGYSSQLI
ncbi:hypothetical protein ROG8370_03953 [Roseovarius gaetbuli]|uniref:Uncharacterized protein n=1 Tax=Roseovarius gaetbuli TaxID=1356575 RepID=A0A1X7ADV9_9RHOB|nr:hypothetical protein ROG8370_03953 [Roseovarius gaetbuli]